MKISAYIKRNYQGDYITTIRIQKELKPVEIKEVPTPESQIREARTSCLWVPSVEQVAPDSWKTQLVNALGSL